ncbi:MAG: uroporphyrinogen decarboxylase family protein [Promethearchaeota archaeon]
MEKIVLIIEIIYNLIISLAFIMFPHRSSFLKALSKESTSKVPLYCTGYPELEFIDNYINQYNLKTDKKALILNNKNYSIIEQIGFDAISLWDFRRGEGGYTLDNDKKVDGWGRIYKGEWYMWDGVFKNEKIVQNWEYLRLPSKKNLELLKSFLIRSIKNLDYVISLPGLFEKTWQSMGFHYFAKCLKKQNLDFLEMIVQFFSDYVKTLIKVLQKTGVKLFLIADDLGYKNRTFISKELWRKLFYKEYIEITNLVHQKKQHIIIHSDGYISDMMGTFIDLGFDAVQSLEPSAGVDIFSLFKKFQNEICFIGNLEMSLLSFGTPQQVRNYTIKLITKAKEHDCSLVVSPSHQINAKCKPKNINAIIETTKIFK